MFKLVEQIQFVDKQCCHKLAYYLSVHRLVANLAVLQELPVLILNLRFEKVIFRN